MANSAAGQDANKPPTPPAKVDAPYKSEYQPKDDTAPAETPVDPDEAENVKLDKELDWLKAVEDAAPVRSADKNEDEHHAYNYILAHARKFGPKALSRHSLRGVPFANLIESVRQDYRNELIHIDGRIIRIDVAKPTDMLSKTAGVKNLYEVWLFPTDRANEANPICLVVTDLPSGVRVGRDLNIWTSFDAYYFKLMKYESGQLLSPGKYQWRVAPLFLGASFNVVDPPTDENDVLSFRGLFVPTVMGLVILVGLTAFGITLYFRHGDRKVKRELQDLRTKTNPFADLTAGTDWNERSPATEK